MTLEFTLLYSDTSHDAATATRPSIPRDAVSFHGLPQHAIASRSRDVWVTLCPEIMMAKQRQ